MFCLKVLVYAQSQSTSICSILKHTLVYVPSQSTHILWSPGPKEMENVVKIMLSCKT